MGNADNSEFFAKYKHPKWQRRRLEIMERSNFTCEACGETEVELQVHHKTYRPGADPWEYEDSNLVSLCRPCHEQRTHLDRSVRSATADLTNDQLQDLLDEIDRRRNRIDVTGDWNKADSDELEELDELRRKVVEAFQRHDARRGRS